MRAAIASRAQGKPCSKSFVQYNACGSPDEFPRVAYQTEQFQIGERVVRTKHIRLSLAFAICLALLLTFYSPSHGQSAPADQIPSGPTRLLRYADISKDKIVFSYAGDLWVSPREGGSARRLTSSPGDKLFPKFSPDGKSIAF